MTAPALTMDGPRLVGQFDHVTLHRNRPRTLATWQLTTTDARIAARVARLLGGHPQQRPSGAAEVITTTATLPIVLDGPDAVRVAWQPGPGRACDGAAQDDGRPCACPAALALRRAAAKQGHACQPAAEVCFRLRDDPALGWFAFVSEDWSFVELAIEAQIRLHDDAPASARLGLHRTLHPLRSGRELAYTRAVITLAEFRSRSDRQRGAVE